MTLRVRALDANNDMQFGASQQQYLVDSPDAVAQIVETTLRLWLGEWYLDLEAGTPWAQGVLGKNSQATADQTIIAQIKSVQWVTDVSNFQSTVDPNTRTYTEVGGILYTQFGSTPFSFSNLGAQ